VSWRFNLPISIEGTRRELHERDRNHGRGLHAQDARAQADDFETGLRGRGDFFFCECPLCRWPLGCDGTMFIL